VEHFEDDDDNYNDSDDVEDISVHGSWITHRYPRRQAIMASSIVVAFEFRLLSRPAVPRGQNKTPGDEHFLDSPGAKLLAWSKSAKQNVNG
jgi:hypothetical protein